MNTPAKPIEPGCLAMIIQSYAGNTGIVTVIEKIGYVDGFEESQGPRWRVDRSMNTGVDRSMNTEGKDIKVPFLGEYQLLRIDDPDLQKQIESEQEKQILAGMPWTEVSNEKA